MSAAPDPRLKVVLCWHLHQPQYRDLASGEPLRPWTYLHGIRDYVDMAVHLETVPDACAVVNFSPVLLEQLDAYCTQLRAHLRDGAPLADPVLGLLAPGGVPEDRSRWPPLVRACLRGHREQLAARFEGYRELAILADRLLATGALADASPQLLADLAAWYHLAWFGETVHRGDPRVRELALRTGRFTAAQRRTLLEVVADVLAGLVPRYRRLAGSGRVELSVSPWAHPLLPLLFDFGAARDADPGLPLPAAARYPGGADRARWHLARAVQAFSRAFGIRPRGCWPPEGALSEPVLRLVESFGFDWVASGESLLRRSLDPGAAPGREQLSCAYRVAGGRAACFFRDDELSDLIGFTYARWNGDDAAADFVRRLDGIAAAQEDNSRRAVSIVLEGDSAWEFYPFNGYYFLRALYQRLAMHPRLRPSTFSACLQEGVTVSAIPRLAPGSWIGGSLSTWIGQPACNRAWDRLCAAKALFDQVVVEGALDEPAQRLAEEQLAACEGSDWFWALDEQGADEATRRLDPIYRRHLRNLYRLLGEAPPDSLQDAGAYTGGPGPQGHPP